MVELVAAWKGAVAFGAAAPLRVSARLPSLRVPPWVGAARWDAAAIAVIVAFVVWGLREFALDGYATAQHPDLLTVWLPNHCLLGTSLREGFIPTWNPYAMGGAPFASDPQSGWMNFLAMGLYSVTECSTALRLYVVAQPLLAGVFVFAFLRSERVGRKSALAGGLLIAAAMSASRVVVSLAFSGTIAWSAVLLFTLSRSLRSTSRATTLAWAAGACLAAGQLAGVHGTHGLAVGALAAAAYVAGARRVTIGRKLRLVAGMVLLTPLLNAALVLPRLAYVGRSSLGTGYSGDGSSIGVGLDPDTLLRVFSPGPLLAGGVVCALAVVGAARCRVLALAAVALGALSLDATASTVASSGLDLPLIDEYLHDPSRLAIGFLLIVPILAGYGIALLADATRGIRARTPWARATGVAATFCFAGVVLSAGVAGRPATAAAGVVHEGRFGPLHAASVDLPDYLSEGLIARTIAAGGAGRFVTLDLATMTTRGYLDRQEPEAWPALANQRGMLLGVEDAQAVTQPVQLARYWTYMRAAGAATQKYNASFFDEIDPVAAYLLDIAYVVSPAPLHGGDLPTEGAWAISRTFDDPPRVELRHDWQNAASPSDALATVTGPGFDRWADLVVEKHVRDPRCAEVASSRVDVLEQRAGLLVARTSSTCAGVLLVHSSYDEGWTASIDGRSAGVVPADYLLQGIPLPAGDHLVRLVHRDAAVTWGLLVSAVAGLGTIGAIGAARFGRQRSASRRRARSILRR
ncbi:MAG TPA: hypothetical protein VHN37_06750 [Actinomycetota bacterium]|nr:hypothetical protein [Actinomycetota bacterium]